MFFYGTFEYSIDEKGRVAVPAKFRDALRGSGDDRLFLTTFITQNVRCLDVYPVKAWEELQAKVAAKPQFDPGVINFFQNYYFARAQDLLIDKQGRVLIPTDLREYAGLKRDIVFTGAMGKFRLWDREAYRPVFESGERALIENPNLLSGIGV